jgi:chaperonin GroES
MNLTPIGDRVVVLPARAQLRSAGGLILSTKVHNEQEQGIVLAVGPKITSGVYAGQRVVFPKGQHQKTTLDGQELLVLRDGDLMAVLEP